MHRAYGSGLIAGLAGLAAACSDPPTSPSVPLPVPAFDAVVSDPIPHRVSSSVGPAGVGPAFSGAGVDGVAFVSLPPGTVPDAETATVLNRRTQQTVVPTVIEGGFDPVEILADPGDTIATTMVSSSGAASYARSVVPARRRPRVVRTSPARGRTDVAITSHITVVFSEPIDPTTLGATSLTVLHGSDTVPGTVKPMSGSSVTAEFLPAGPLAPGTAYQLLISDKIRDLAGDELESEAPTGFTTSSASTTPDPVPSEPNPPDPTPPDPVPPVPPSGSEIPAGAQLEFTIQPGEATAYTNLAPAVTVTVRNANGDIITGFSGPVTILLGAEAGSPRQGAQWQANAVAGVARFAELSIPDPGAYTLVASVEPGLAVTSDTFTVIESPWVSLAPSSGPATRSYAASAVANGKLYYLGGTTDQENLLGAVADVDAYDPATNTWSSRAPMPEPRSRAGAGVVDGILYVVGGSDATGTMHASVFAYDPIADSWTARASLPERLAHPGIGSVNGKLYAVGGIDERSDAVARVSVYDPATNAWTSGPPMPTPRGGPGIAVVGSTLYAIGGGVGFGFVDNVESYDAGTGSWTIRPPMPTARGFMGITSRNGLVYAIAGFTDDPYYHWIGRVEIFDPLGDTWSVIPSIPSGGQTAAGTINDIVYALGGWSGLVQLGP